MTIDPRVGFWFSIVMAVIGVIAAAGSQLTDLGLSPNSVKAILAISTLLLSIGSAINAILHAVPSKADAAGDFYLGPKGGSK